MVKFFILMVMAVVFCAAWPFILSAQTAIEYGVIGSKTTSTSSGAMGKVGKEVDNSLKRSACSDKTCGSKQVSKSARTVKTKEIRATERQAAKKGTGSGPLVIEKRGNHYVRVN